MNLTERYSRQTSLKNFDQQKLSAAKILIVGAGGLGSPAAMYLAAAGVGQIGIVDGDKVELSNLQRQILHATRDLNRPKVFSARETLNALNPDVQVSAYNERLAADNAREILHGWNFVLDCTDNFAAKFLINDACVALRKPFAHAGILHFGGQLMTVLPNQSACYRCVFEEEPPPETFGREGIFNVVAGVIGSLQAAEALKFFLNVGELLTDSLLTFDALTMTFRRIKISRNKNCAACGEVNSC